MSISHTSSKNFQLPEGHFLFTSESGKCNRADIMQKNVLEHVLGDKQLVKVTLTRFAIKYQTLSSTLA